MDITCPQCGAEVPGARSRLRLTCVSCGLRFGNPGLGDLPPAVEQVRRDRTGAGVTLLLLAGLGVLGSLSLGALSPAFLLVAALGTVGLVLARSEGGTHPLLKVFLGVLAVGGVLVLLAAAALAYLFIQCSRGEFGWNG